MTLDFIQIIYDEDQRQHCYPFATVYKNEKCTPFFENDVIADRVSSCTGDLVGVVSWRLRQKRGDMFRLADKSLSHERIMEQDFDVAILTPRGHKDILTKILHWHPQTETLAAIYALRKIIDFPETVDHSIYENHFIARREIYQEYVETCLKPAMEFMKDKPVFFADAGYINRKTGKEKEQAMALLSSWGRTDYPLAPFILERLFSIWITGKGFKVIEL
jgi:hypothetical protein